MAFKVGDKVRLKWDETEGEVLEVRDDNVSTGAKYFIKWPGPKSAKGPTNVTDWEHGDQLQLIDPEDEKRVAAQIQEKLNEAQSAMEKAWEAYSGARELAYQNNYSLWSFMDRNLIDIGPFAGAAGNFGWETSSLYCP